MTGSEAPRGGPRPDRDGIASTTREGVAGRAYLVAALVIVVAAAAFLLSQPDAGRADGAADAQAGGGAEAPAASGGPAQRIPLVARPPSTQDPPTVLAPGGEDPTADLSDVLPPGSAPSMSQVIDGLHQAGVRSGLGAFPKPGTSPPLVGLAVPEDYPLPHGYVRHYQATDDGQRIEPILMFAPEARFVDASGRSVELPPDRVVPPDMAPPGMPVRLIRIPPPRPGGGP